MSYPSLSPKRQQEALMAYKVHLYTMLIDDGDKDYELAQEFLDWLYHDESTVDWGDEITDSQGGSWQRSTIKTYINDEIGSVILNKAQFLGREVEETFRAAVLDLCIIEQNPYASLKSGKRPSEGEQLVNEGHDVAQVILNGVYIGWIVDGNFKFYEGRGLIS